MQISYNELMNYMEEVGVCIHEQCIGYKRTEVKGFFNFLTTIFNGLATNVMRIFLRVRKSLMYNCIILKDFRWKLSTKKCRSMYLIERVWGLSEISTSTIFWIFWCLTPLSAIFQLYHDDQFKRWKKPEYPERTTDHGQATGKLYHSRLGVECTLFVIYKAGSEPTPYWW